MAYIFKKNSSIWYLIDKSRKPSWIQLGRISQAEAKQVLRKYETDTTYLRLGLPIAPYKIQFQEMSEEYLKEIRKTRYASTVTIEEGYLKVLYQEFGSSLIHEITHEQVESFFSMKGYKPNTWRLMTQTLRRMYNLALERKYISENSMLKITIPKIGKTIPKFVDINLLDELISNMDGKIKSYYLILRYTGMRPGEVLKLKAKDVREIKYKDRQTGKELKKEALFFRSSKTNTDRVIPLHPTLLPVIKKLIENKKGEDFLFPSKNGNDHQKSMNNGIKRAVKKLGMTGISMYTFRHSVATEMLAKTGDLRAVQTVLGHTSSKTTEIYAHALEAAQINAIDQL